MTGSVSKVLFIGLAFALIPISSSSTIAAGPQTPSCGTYKVMKSEVIVGVVFSKGNYQINTFGISCAKVMGSKGLFAQFQKPQLAPNKCMGPGLGPKSLYKQATQ
jgi:hypothetical protein